MMNCFKYCLQFQVASLKHGAGNIGKEREKPEKPESSGLRRKAGKLVFGGAKAKEEVKKEEPKKEAGTHSNPFATPSSAV